MANRLASDIQANKDAVKDYFYEIDDEGFPSFHNQYLEDMVNGCYKSKAAVLEVIQGRTGRFDALKIATQYAQDLALWKALVSEVEWLSFVNELAIARVSKTSITDIKKLVNAQFEVLLAEAKGLEVFSGVVEVVVTWMEVKHTAKGTVIRYRVKEEG